MCRFPVFAALFFLPISAAAAELPKVDTPDCSFFISKESCLSAEDEGKSRAIELIGRAPNDMITYCVAVANYNNIAKSYGGYMGFSGCLSEELMHIDYASLVHDLGTEQLGRFIRDDDTPFGSQTYCIELANREETHRPRKDLADIDNMQRVCIMDQNSAKNNLMQHLRSFPSHRVSSCVAAAKVRGIEEHGLNWIDLFGCMNAK